MPMFMSCRFYAELNDFLPRERRGVRFTQTLRHAASVKDVIEALGVPHPEVGEVLVNGAIVTFGYRVRDGDAIDVYPATALPPEPLRFSVDPSLGKLASLLRLAGFDAECEVDAGARVLLTRNVERLKPNAVEGYWLRETEPERQFAEVLRRFRLTGRMQPFTRCMVCNVPLQRVEPATVATEIPPRTRAEFHEFHRCRGCGRIYWRGSHYQQLQALLDRVSSA
jgi:uncharacterized protein